MLSAKLVASIIDGDGLMIQAAACSETLLSYCELHITEGVMRTLDNFYQDDGGRNSDIEALLTADLKIFLQISTVKIESSFICSFTANIPQHDSEDMCLY